MFYWCKSWPCMLFFLYLQMATCPTCAPRQKLKTLNPVLQPILSHKPWSYVGIDLIGPLSETPMFFQRCPFFFWQLQTPTSPPSTHWGCGGILLLPSTIQSQMVECSQCKEWYHDECEGVNVEKFILPWPFRAWSHGTAYGNATCPAGTWLLVMSPVADGNIRYMSAMVGCWRRPAWRRPIWRLRYMLI